MSPVPILNSPHSSSPGPRSFPTSAGGDSVPLAADVKLWRLSLKSFLPHPMPNPSPDPLNCTLEIRPSLTRADARTRVWTAPPALGTWGWLSPAAAAGAQGAAPGRRARGRSAARGAGVIVEPVLLAASCPGLLGLSSLLAGLSQKSLVSVPSTEATSGQDCPPAGPWLSPGPPRSAGSGLQTPPPTQSTLSPSLLGPSPCHRHRPARRCLQGLTFASCALGRNTRRTGARASRGRGCRLPALRPQHPAQSPTQGGSPPTCARRARWHRARGARRRRPRASARRHAPQVPLRRKGPLAGSPVITPVTKKRNLHGPC